MSVQINIDITDVKLKPGLSLQVQKLATISIFSVYVGSWQYALPVKQLENRCTVSCRLDCIKKNFFLKNI